MAYLDLSRNVKIVRLFGTGRVVRPDSAEFEQLKRHFNTAHVGIRAMIVIDTEKAKHSCGFAMPYMVLVDEGPVLDKRAARLDPDHPLPTAVAR